MSVRTARPVAAAVCSCRSMRILMIVCADGGIWRNRVQTFDATFGLEPTDEVTLHCRR